MRYPGIILGIDEAPFIPLLNYIAEQLKISAESWNMVSGIRQDENI
jgi:hypothetical protein